MKEETIFENLCIYDERNPNYYQGGFDEDEKRKPRINCNCDNCFYGKDKLALEIIKLKTLTI